ncbi:S-adenosyl-L-methionine-dependent methyltransferase [Glarea lozoyensis ATCC 20868]|uniref:S-adenosyl-L-methionine-dependent methyltransferase n=1 Tax=Glarea lozoyensis (strain ATCC 20868 / MF5171) TaxID=1116229 RepID=S3E0M2_GLAL2|nr:S-adenosyl-L-methionine-dependent methyltransferase [Glarea lozoyensis ATCC 20868]EPE32083.1 S-adenosyl-L-methionine-dependent methyltransferase [Glarea lozoyensis ATCC 20868]
MSAETILNLPANHGARSTNLPWYQPSLENKLNERVRRVFEEYSRIPPDEVESHVYEVRELAWSVFPWPCIGEFWFLELGLTRHPEYNHVLRTLKEGSVQNLNPKILDLGTCLGQDLRELAHNGAPINTLYGADLVAGFEAVGYELFRDSNRFGPSNFITGNIFSNDIDDGLVKTRGTWDIIHATMFLHIWALEDQEKACVNILKLLRQSPGSLVVGTQTGTAKPGEFTVKPPLCEPGEQKVVYRHSKETMRDMWMRAGMMVGMSLDVKTGYDEEERMGREKGRLEKGPEWEAKQRFFAGSDQRRIFLTVLRLG